MKRKKYKKWSQEEINKLRINYSIINNNILSDIFNISKMALHKKARKLNLLKIRLDNLNESFFKIWTEPMAYILGFTTADGYIINKLRQRQLGYGINTKDIEILYFIVKSLGIDRNKIKIRERKYLSAELVISSKNIIDSLFYYNVIQNKTGKEKLPQIPQEFKGDYLRGLFDGDGCIRIKNNNLDFNICSASKSFLEDIKSKIGLDYGYINNSGKIFTWNIYKQDHIKHIRDLMYHDNYTFSLTRKRNKFYV